MGTLSVVSKRQPLPIGPVLVPIYRPTPLGNPYHIEAFGRADCIARYRIWLWQRIQEASPQRDELHRIVDLLQRHDVALVCWCKPLACHGDVIASAVSWLRQQQAIEACA